MAFTYDYNAANQRVKSTLADERHWIYEYDDSGQVVSANLTGTTAPRGHSLER